MYRKFRTIDTTNDVAAGSCSSHGLSENKFTRISIQKVNFSPELLIYFYYQANRFNRWEIRLRIVRRHTSFCSTSFKLSDYSIISEVKKHIPVFVNLVLINNLTNSTTIRIVRGSPKHKSSAKTLAQETIGISWRSLVIGQHKKCKNYNRGTLDRRKRHLIAGCPMRGITKISLCQFHPFNSSHSMSTRAQGDGYIFIV